METDNRYQNAKTGYERALARKDYEAAKRYIETMIEVSPCAEALPTLAGWLDDVEMRIRQTKPFWTWLRRRVS